MTPLPNLPSRCTAQADSWKRPEQVIVVTPAVPSGKPVAGGEWARPAGCYDPAAVADQETGALLPYLVHPRGEHLGHIQHETPHITAAKMSRRC